MVDLAIEDKRYLMSRLADLIGALDEVCCVIDDDQIARVRGQCVRLYLDLMGESLAPFDQEAD